MFRLRSLFSALALFAAALAIVPAASAAAEFPTRPITLIVPFPPGGSTDAHVRVIAELASKHLGQPIVIENKGGASGTLGPATMAATAKPDGYTLSVLPITVFRMPFIQKTSFDPKKDFTYIIQLTGYAFGVAVKADAPWQTWEQFLAHAKANPGKVSYGTSGAGSSQHIIMEQIAKQQGIKWIHVPFKGGGEQNAALLGGHIDASASTTGTMAGLIDAGQLRMLVMWTKERSKRLPDVPTLLEAGHGMVATSPYGIGGPAGMDPNTVKILHDAFRKAMEEPAHAAILDKLGFTEDYLGSAAYTEFAMKTIEEERQRVEELGLGRK